MPKQKRKHLLIVDDDKGTRTSLQAVFSHSHRVSQAASAKAASDILTNEHVDIILLDLMMPETDGLSFLKSVQHRYPGTPVVMVSASMSVQPVVEAIRGGAHDFVTKPYEVDNLRLTVDRAEQSSSLRRKISILESESSRTFPVSGIIGQAPAFLRALEDARKAAQAESPVLIQGESGTGKELLARFIHASSIRCHEPFVAAHSAALPETIFESELFGHEKRPATHHKPQTPGHLDLAASGTLFFDEVGEMSKATQVKLLRVLQDHEFMRVGGTETIRTNVRIIAATAKNLDDEMADQHFRDDLYLRLNVIPIRLPPLRERLEDIPKLAQHFIEYYRQGMDVATKELDANTLDLFCRYAWPGNVRELRNVIERVMVLHGKEAFIRPELLPEELQQTPPDGSRNGSQKLADSVSRYEKHLIQNALKQSHGVQTRAAKLLGTTRRILKYRMEKLNIPTSYGQRHPF